MRRFVALLALTSLDVAAQDTSFIPYEDRAHSLVNAMAFSPDGETMYFALLYHRVLERDGLPTEGEPVTAMYRAPRTADGWGEPELMPMSGVYQDYEPALTADGSLMIFNSKRPYPDGRIPETNDIWMMEREGNGWTEPARIDAIASFDHEESYGTLSAARTLVYCRALENADGALTHDLYESVWSDGFQTPTRHPVSADEYGESDPFIAPDGSWLIFTRWDESVGWQETVDLYISFHDGANWSEPIAMDTLNTDGPDYSPTASADGEWLYYRANSRFQRIPLAPILDEYRARLNG